MILGLLKPTSGEVLINGLKIEENPIKILQKINFISPYIENYRLKYLDRGITAYEPRIALDGGNDGFSKVKKVIYNASSLLKNNGKLILEIGFNQKKMVLKILKKNNFYINKVQKDYGMNDRCIICTKI